MQRVGHSHSQRQRGHPWWEQPGTAIPAGCTLAPLWLWGRGWVRGPGVKVPGCSCVRGRGCAQIPPGR